ncbi:hypothetical protein Thiowin_00853 [Thiorhodovibrio winogradskyi]|uniref:Uncharacterized protein n=1 Tax=Thiorhodovibrio winogradskyi TaxID=77007 RepID=A0ABZ0S4G4_9GAMM|nr:hypothetical protein [Thiorhodovibrio winogradskyi]
MAFTTQDNQLSAGEQLSVEDAELLLEWLLKHPRGRIDLSACDHVHAASLQVLMAARPKIAAWPESQPLADWLTATLTEEASNHGKNNSRC